MAPSCQHLLCWPKCQPGPISSSPSLEVLPTNNRGNTYVRASILHDWQGDAESTFTKGGQTKHISEELGDTWLEYGVGANFNATKNLHLYADLEAPEGAKVETSYRFNLGARWSF